MVILSGRGASGGIVSGKIRYYRRAGHDIRRHEVEDPAGEIARFDSARKQAVSKLERLCSEGEEKLGADGSLIFRVHQLMLEDPEYCGAVRQMIAEEQVNAEYAVSCVTGRFFRQIGREDNGYIGSRSADIQDASARVLDILSGREEDDSPGSDPVIIAAEDLTPSETVRLDRHKVLAFITAGGTLTSHTAILARMMGIPAVIDAGNGICEQLDGKQALVDGFSGEVYIAPDAETVSRFQEYARRNDADQERLASYRDRETVTSDGRAIRLRANISTPEELEAVKRSGAEGIGLFRSEFLYLLYGGYPGEEYQYTVYREVLEQMAGKLVIIRTMDVGADKLLGYSGVQDGENPALGMRGIRLSMNRPELFRIQLRALYRASAHGKLAILFPMITSVRELRWARERTLEVRAELKEQGLPYSDSVMLGAMIETPAAAVLSDRLAQEADFFSIGTNDLTQYTLALDRGNSSLLVFGDDEDEAVMRLIALTAKNAHRAGIPVGICGELGGSASRLEAFMDMGIDALSIAPGSILPLREKICSM